MFSLVIDTLCNSQAKCFKRASIPDRSAVHESLGGLGPMALLILESFHSLLQAPEVEVHGTGVLQKQLFTAFVLLLRQSQFQRMLSCPR